MKIVNSLIFCIVFLILHVQAQEEVVFTSHSGKIEVWENEKGKLYLNVPPNFVDEMIHAGEVGYKNFGAKGDGKTDDINAIAAAHAFANMHQLRVRAQKDATYYISGKRRTAFIKTDTDFGTAAFIIDDTDVEDRTTPVFEVKSDKKPFLLQGISSLRRNQKKIDVDLPDPSLIMVVNRNVKQYIRMGRNQNKGSSQKDIFLVDKEGNVDMDSPIIWDFDEISEIKAIPIDTSLLKITGGVFTTIANQAPSKYTYYARNILIKRSHVTIENMQHYVKGEKEQGAPYNGFLHIQDGAYITVQNSLFTGRKTYTTKGAAGKSVSMGSYDLIVNRSLHVSFLNCTQSNDINDRKFWGIMGSNFSKNLVYDGCELSRFDAHQGVANATIRNSTLGHMGINLIGSGTFTLENSKVLGWSLLNLRSDYGSTWQGDVIIRNSVFKPFNGRTAVAPVLIAGFNDGQHDFGYVCYMPRKIVIENLLIDDSHHPKEYKGPAIFADFNPQLKEKSYQEAYPYMKTEKVILQNIRTSSGKKLRVSHNPFMFKGVEIIEK